MGSSIKLLFCLFAVWTACGPSTGQNTETAGNKISLFSKNKEIVCFIYHRFGDARYPSTNTSMEDFSAHLSYLKRENFSVMTLSKAIEYLENDSEEKKIAVITIDDGFKSFKEKGWPLLKQYNFPATLFINTETVGGNSYLDWGEINELVSYGIEIGNHTHSHAYFLDMPESTRYSTFKKEVLQCQSLIESHTGKQPEVFAYPYGEYDKKMETIIQEMGFKVAAAQNSGVIYSGTNRMALPRFPMSNAYADSSKFQMKAEMHPIRILSMTPDNYVLSGDGQPSLELEFDGKDLRISEIQCFIQGSSCDTNISELENGHIKMVLLPNSNLSKRRTLYTITVPDINNEWHWFSQLWINPTITE